MRPHKSFKVGREGVILGVYEEPDMVYMVSCGKVLGTDDYWTEGMSTWAKVSSREIWTVSSEASSSSPALSPPISSASPGMSSNSSPTDLEVRREELVELEMNRRRQIRENSTVSSRVKSPSVSFFSIWWKTALVIYVGGACLGYLSGEGYGLGQMLAKGLLTAPFWALPLGGIIYAFSRNSEASAEMVTDHAKVIREFDRSKVLKK